MINSNQTRPTTTKGAGWKQNERKTRSKSDGWTSDDAVD